jgi:hypothetical protein
MMRHIRVLEPSRHWDDLLLRCQGATVFQQSAWLAMLRQCFKAHAQMVHIPLGSGHYALFALGIRPCGRGWLPLAIAGDAGAYGGLVATRPLHPHESHLICQWVLAQYPAVVINGNPFGTTTPLPSGCKALPDETHCLDLAPRHVLSTGFSRGCRARGNKARRQGLELDIQHGQEGVAQFYPIYLDSVRRWGDRLTWLRPLAFFERIADQFGAQATVMLARQNDKPISGLFLLHGYGLCHYVAGATHHDAQAVCPSNFLIEEALDWAYTTGLTRFDFGPSHALEGVRQFKASFGATAIPMMGFSRLPWPQQAYLKVRQYLQTRSTLSKQTVVAGTSH